MTTPMIAPPGPPQQEARPPRPPGVRAAGYVQAGITILLLVLAAIVVVLATSYDDLITRAANATSADPTAVSDERFGNVVQGIILGGFALGLALWFGILTVPLQRGHQAARVLTTIGVGVPALFALCSAGGGLLFAMADGSSGDAAGPSDAFSNELDRLGGQSVWPDLAVPILVLAFLGAGAALVILMFLPSANRFFRPGGRAAAHAAQYVPYPVYWPVQAAAVASPPAPGPTQPTAEPTAQPTAQPPGEPTAGPTAQPTGEPAAEPTAGTGAPVATTAATAPGADPYAPPADGAPAADPTSGP